MKFLNNNTQIAAAVLSVALLAPIPAQADDNYVQVCGRSMGGGDLPVAICTGVTQNPPGMGKYSGTGNYMGTNCTPGVSMGEKTLTVTVQKGQPIYACILTDGVALCGFGPSNPFSVGADYFGEYYIKGDLLSGLKIQYSDPAVRSCAEPPPANKQ